MTSGDELGARVAALRADGLIGDAAQLLAHAGEHARASALFEEACSFGAAAEQALAADDLRAAARLAALHGDAALTARVRSGLLAAGDREQTRWVAEDLSARGHHGLAASLLRALGALEEAAASYDLASCVLDAAACWDEAGKPVQAARVLEAALRSAGDVEPAEIRVALGTLYSRHGKHQAAVRVLQQVPTGSEQRRRGLLPLRASLQALGLQQALRDLEPELRARGLDRVEDKAADAGEAPVDAVLYGRYRVVREVATTPHARLLEAIDQLGGKRVAVKILAGHTRGTGRDALARFVREARALNRLRHPNVAPLEAFVEEGPAMVLAWMGGGSLRELLDREALSPARSAEVARALLDALAEAHRLGILHRDIKPSNLLFDDGGAARLADFGAAHMAASDATVTVGDIGTAAYMAPEQRAGRAATVQSDLFGVGVLLFEMLTGSLPQSGPASRVSTAHPDLGDDHDALMATFLAASPSARFSSALNARRAVEALDWSPRVMARQTTVQQSAIAAPAPKERPDARLQSTDEDGRWYDNWLGRELWVLPLEPDIVQRAAAFARAGHPRLAAVLRVVQDSGELWIEVPRGASMAGGAKLSERQREQLRGALAALHRAGGVHGAVNGEHVHVDAGCAMLAFPREARGDAAASDDLGDLERL